MLTDILCSVSAPPRCLSSLPRRAICRKRQRGNSWQHHTRAEPQWIRTSASRSGAKFPFLLALGACPPARRGPRLRTCSQLLPRCRTGATKPSSPTSLKVARLGERSRRFASTHLTSTVSSHRWPKGKMNFKKRGEVMRWKLIKAKV